MVFWTSCQSFENLLSDYSTFFVNSDICCDYAIKVSKEVYHYSLSLALFRFCEAKYLHFTTRVFRHSAISTFLGGPCRPRMHYSHSGRPRTVDSRFLVLLGSENTIAEITEYLYFSPLKPRCEFQNKSN